MAGDVKHSNFSTVSDVESRDLEQVLTVGRKFLISILISVILLMVCGFVGWYHLNKIHTGNKNLINHHSQIKEEAMFYNAAVKQYEAKLKEYSLSKDNDLKGEISNLKGSMTSYLDKLGELSTTSREDSVITPLFESNEDLLRDGNGFEFSIDEALGVKGSTGSTEMGSLSGEDLVIAETGNPSTTEASDPLAGLDDFSLNSGDGDISLDLDESGGDLGELNDLNNSSLDLTLNSEIDLSLDSDLDLGLDVDEGASTSGGSEMDDLELLDFDLSSEAYGQGVNIGDGNGNILLASQDFTSSLEEVYMDVRELLRSNEKQEQLRLEELENDVTSGKIYLMLLIVILIVFNVLQYFYFNRSVTRPIKSLRRYLISMGKGELPEFKMKVWRDDIGEMVRSVRNLLAGLKQTAVFAQELGNGNLEAEYEMLSNNDILGKSLMDMRDNLTKLADEDEKRNWVNQGVATFSEILRANNDNLEHLSDQIILYLVNYLKVNQAALFLINDIDKKDIHLEIASIYAWDRKKFLDTKIEKGQGLVGQCWYEQKTIFMTDVPEEFVYITSGLGQATPRCILIVPLIANEEIYGVMEFAAFRVLEEYEIDFIEKVAESIAAAIGNVRITERTKNLLEEAQQQGEELRANEEEMRQNMEEMNATQEEMDRIIQEKDVQIDQLQEELAKLKEA